MKKIMTAILAGFMTLGPLNIHIYAEQESADPEIQSEENTASESEADRPTPGTSIGQEDVPSSSMDSGPVECPKEAEETFISPAAETAASLNSTTATNGTLTFQVQWPTQVTCGTETNFVFTTTGGSGNYRYRLYSMYVQDGDETVMVCDPHVSANGFKPEASYPFTFYASGTYMIRFVCMDMEKYTTINSNMIFLTINDEKYPSTNDIATKLAQECEKVCTTDYEKALWFHDWLMTNSKYDNSFMYCSAEGVMARGKGTCESFTTAYAKMLDAVGIPNDRALGNGHTWSVVLLDGKWYQIDTTWDNTGYSTLDDFQSHLYFGITDEMMKNTHNEHEPNAERVCDSLEENYFIRSGKITAWSDRFTAQVQQAIDEGKQSFSISADGTFPGMEYQNPPTNYKNIMYPLTAYYLENKMEWTKNAQSVQLSARYESDQLHCTVTENVKKKETITFDVNLGNELQVQTKEVNHGEPMGNLPVPTRNGFTFEGWYTKAVGGSPVTEDTVCTQSLTVFAHWKEIIHELTALDITADQLLIGVGETADVEYTSEPFDLVPELRWESSDADVVTVDPYGKLFGRKIGSATITVRDLDGKFSDRVNVIVEFTDVRKAANKNYYSKVYWAADNNITVGYKDPDGLYRQFRPDDTCTRGQMVMFLWKLMGQPTSSGVQPFNDVFGTGNTAKSVTWAYENGVTIGTKNADGSVSFLPDDSCTRLDAVMFLWKLAGKPKYNDVVLPFTDVDDKAPGVSAIKWAYKNKITIGYTEADGTKTFRPDKTCERWEIVTFMKKFADKFLN